MLSRSLRAVARLRSTRFPISSVRTYATPQSDKPPENGSPKQSDEAKQEKPSIPELPKGLEGFFKQYEQLTKKPTQHQESSTSKEQDSERQRNDNRRNEPPPPPPNNNGFTNSQLAWLLA